MYLKTTYRNHCEEDDSKCADHCRVFALSHAGDTDVQKVCSHSHNVKCEDCEKLKSVLEEVKGEDYLYEAKNAAGKIFKWRGHIMRAKTRISTSGKLLIL